MYETSTGKAMKSFEDSLVSKQHRLKLYGQVTDRFISLARTTDTSPVVCTEEGFCESLGECVYFVYSQSTKKVISGFQALCQVRTPAAGLEPATEEKLQISYLISYPLRH
ncbi:hypothetical protein PoB_004517300 [Plakobranchus ocellatus]|uniref:Uncharacterized protein n=1 Tax=Plakobranchus ocellatus TaxID=259542 RepID=A0AAV4BGE5_9GAST|nr:hypothetical protein PoB_004517300 [Plakobranchus ocellatus]